jgi:BMFP domain-containing protein YqiC
MTMSEELKACSICGAPGLQMWDPEENIIKCSSEGICHNALYGMYFKEWQARPIEDALAARIVELEARIAELVPQCDAAYAPYRERAQEAREESDRLGEALYAAQEKIGYLENELTQMEKAEKEMNQAILHYLSRYPTAPILKCETMLDGFLLLMECVGFPKAVPPEDR